jgi:hypothetical protein
VYLEYCWKGNVVEVSPAEGRTRYCTRGSQAICTVLCSLEKGACTNGATVALCWDRLVYMSMSALCKVPGVHAQTERLSPFGRCFLFETRLLLEGLCRQGKGYVHVYVCRA